jgi:hypothetical protein
MDAIEETVAEIAREAQSGDVPYEERLARGRDIASRLCAGFIRDRGKRDGADVLQEQLDSFREALVAAASGLEETEAAGIFMTLAEEM